MNLQGVFLYNLGVSCESEMFFFKSEYGRTGYAFHVLLLPETEKRTVQIAGQMFRLWK